MNSALGRDISASMTHYIYPHQTHH